MSSVLRDIEITENRSREDADTGYGPGMQDEPVKKKAVSPGTGIALGIAMGIPIGVLIDNVAFGIAIGAALGVAFGVGGHARRTKADSTPEPPDRSE
jgi:hypothetical protein